MTAQITEELRWARVRTQLDQTYTYNHHWDEAIDILDSRLKNKFFAPVEFMLAKKAHKGEGFAILTVQCTLIEMFAAFRVGKIYNYNKTAPYEYNQSKKMFISLLHTAPIFQDHFYTLNLKGNPITNTPYNAEGFYSEVRCGLMHEARTKGNWRINTAPKITDVKNERHFIRATNGNLHIYRTVLHYRLLAYLDSYKAELRQVSPNGIDLRKKFARKMDNLFDFQHDTAFDWWVV